MKDTLESIRDGLRQNSFVNEASVSQGIVLRLLRELGWEAFDVDIVSPEYSVKGRRVDFALCHPRRKPRVFVEVKQVSKLALDFEEQLAAYAYEEGVPLVVLTTGKEWNFYVPYGPGKFVDRRVYRIDLLERSTDEIIERMQRYLAYDAVRTGSAFVHAQNDLQEVLSDQETRRQLPEVWKRLLQEPASELVELVMQRLESLTGEKPRVGVVEGFLRRQAPSVALVGNPPPPEPPKPPESVDNGLRLEFLGQAESFTTHRARLIRVFERVSQRDPSFFETYSGRAVPGRRPGIARRPVDLFPKKESLANTRNNYAEIGNGSGWYIDLNQSARNMEKMIQRACNIAGLEYGRDVRIS
jgi:predicted type IV restriction endonuclease